MMFKAMGGAPAWPFWTFQAGVVGVYLGVLSAFFCALGWVLRRSLSRRWALATGLLLAASALTAGVSFWLMAAPSDMVR